MLNKIYHKKNELFAVESFQDKECIEAFDFTNAKDLYIDGLNGDVTPFMFLYGKIESCNLCIPFLPNTKQIEVYSLLNSVLHARGIKLYTLSNIENVSNRIACIDNTSIFTITPNLSKYIPEDNAVLFLSEEDCNQYGQDNFEWVLYDYAIKHTNYDFCKKATIFLPHGTQSETEKAMEVSKYLWENFGIKPNLCALHWFYKNEDYDVISFLLYNKIFNKIITTNSTGILKPEDNEERLQVIDCFNIFQDHLNNI